MCYLCRAMEEGRLALWYLTWRGGADTLEEGAAPWDGRPLEERETEELVAFVRLAMEEIRRRGVPSALLPTTAYLEAAPLRITRGLRIFIGQQELKMRPMSKTVLLLFLRHPEGILLKQIGDYRREMEGYYRRLNRSSNPMAVQQRICRIVDIFNNDLNVNISRINTAITALVNGPAGQLYHIRGTAGTPKSIPLDRSLVIWE